MKKAITFLVVAILFGLVGLWMANLARALTITGVSPDSGPSSGYQEVTISGLDIGIATRYVTQIATGYNHSLAVTSDGKIYAWGRNNYGQLGDGTTTDHGKPVAVNMSGVLAGKKVTQVAGGEAFSLALTDDGKAYAWGYNNRGQLGVGNTTNQSAPVAVNMVSGALAGKTVTQIAAGREFALALTSDGKVFSWGRNYYGQAGVGTTGGNNTSPVATDMNANGTCLAGKTVKQIAVGGWHSLALTTDGVFCAWGYNNYGQLGDGTTTTRSRPVAVNVTTSALAGKTITKISANNTFTMALSSSGGIFAFGENNRGQLGDGTTTNRSLAVATNMSGVLSGKTIVDISAGGYDGSALALDSEGKIYAWGYNNYGQLGIGSTTTQTTPAAVNMSGALAGKTITSVDMGYYHTLALTDDGQVYAWGYNNYGQLGKGNIGGNSTTPTAADNTFFSHVPLPLTVTIGGKFCRDITTRANNITTHIAADGSSLQCLTPVHSAGLVDVAINDTVHAVVTLPQSYRYVSSGAAVGGIVPAAGATAGGNAITIEGVGFGAYDDAATKYASCGSAANPYQTFTITQTATYKLEVWGAQGGTGLYSTTRTHPGGKGGYSVGEIALNAGDELNIFVGCKGQDGSINSGVPIVGGYNGGGGVPRMVSTGNYAPGGGGGGTDIRLNGANLSDRVIVAGGGGGGGTFNETNVNDMGGFGGGASGGDGVGNSTKQPYDGGGAGSSYGGAAGGNGSTSNGNTIATAGALGQGGEGGYLSNNYYYGAGGGGGYYGGGGANGRGAGGGGSGYIGNVLQRKQTLAGNLATIPDPAAADIGFMTGKAGDGYARITMTSKLPSVTVGGQDCAVRSWQEEAIVCVVAAHAKGAVDVVLNIGGAVITEADSYTYVDAPSVANVSPNLGPTTGGAGFGGGYNPAGRVTITGNGFQVPSSASGGSYYIPVVMIGGRECADVVLLSNTQLTCVPPESGLASSHAEGAASVSVAIVGATGTLNNGYTYRAPLLIETICQVGTGPTTIDTSKEDDEGVPCKPYGPDVGGTAVVITGWNFLASGYAGYHAPTVSLGGANCAVTGTTTNSQIKCTTSSHAAGLVSAAVDNGFDVANLLPVWNDTGTSVSENISSSNVDSGWLYTGVFLSMTSNASGGVVSFTTSPSGGIGSNYDIVTVKTNNGSGYSLSMATTDNRLICTGLNTCSGRWFNSITASGALDSDTWGWNVDIISDSTNSSVATLPTSWRPVPLVTSPANDKLIYTTPSPSTYTDNIGDKFRLWFGAKASQTLPATNYTQVVTITVIGN